MSINPGPLAATVVFLVAAGLLFLLGLGGVAAACAGLALITSMFVRDVAPSHYRRRKHRKNVWGRTAAGPGVAGWFFTGDGGPGGNGDTSSGDASGGPGTGAGCSGGCGGGGGGCGGGGS